MFSFNGSPLAQPSTSGGGGRKGAAPLERRRIVYADREEVLQAGDLFYLPPGHTPLVEEDTEFVEFSRPAEHQPVLDHVARAAGAS